MYSLFFGPFVFTVRSYVCKAHRFELAACVLYKSWERGAWWNDIPFTRITNGSIVWHYYYSGPLSPRSPDLRTSAQRAHKESASEHWEWQPSYVPMCLHGMLGIQSNHTTSSPDILLFHIKQAQMLETFSTHFFRLWIKWMSMPLKALVFIFPIQVALLRPYD